MAAARLLVVLSRIAVAVALSHAAWSADRSGWTYDEEFHLRWSQRLVLERNGDRSDQIRYDSKTPISVPNALALTTAERLDLSARARKLAARLPTVVLLGVLFWAVGPLGRRLGGEHAGHGARLLAALDPNLTAHGSLATVDVVYALTVVLFALAFLRACDTPGWRAMAGLGLALGLALVAKFSALLLLPVVVLLPGFARRPSASGSMWVLRLALVGAVVLLTLATAYLWLNVGEPLGDHRWRHPALSKAAAVAPGFRPPVPLPFLTGLDASLAGEGNPYVVLLLGYDWPGGVWFYFLVHALLKTPLALLIAILAGAWRLARGPLARSTAVRAVLLIFLVHAAYFSFVFRAQVGYRFVLACIPLLAALVAAGLARGLASRRAGLVLAGLVSLALLEQVPFAGNPLAFTNSVVMDKREAFRFVADSNLDWGQGREPLAGRLRQARVPHDVPVNPVHPLPGRNVVGVNELSGLFGAERFRLLREQAKPLRHFDHTALLFDLPEDVFARWLASARVVGPDTGDRCRDVTWRRTTRRDALRLTRDQQPAAGQTWLLCANSQRGHDLEVEAVQGRVVFGRLIEGRGCVGDLVGPGQRALWRVGPGTTALCLEELPNRRPHVPYSLELRIRSRTNPVTLALVSPDGGLGAEARP
ncbi:MAG: glycosyltransferase family 39 protein [Vicinamibacteria bacterium]|nr:glycosyltransferase family 39 protein [Vicinamibacteria bacterium]